MSNAKKHVLAIGTIAITSQIYLSLFTQDFMVSAGIISFFIITYFFRDLNKILTGIISGIMVCLLRVLVSLVYGGSFLKGIISFSPEIFFYIVIGISIHIFIKFNFLNDLGKVFFTALITDILANGTEMAIRSKMGLIVIDYKILGTLMAVAISRTFIIWIILNGLKYYKILLVNKKNAEKYKEFLIISSGLKAEMYLMERNMEYIEKSMEEAYNLYEKIHDNVEIHTWEKDAISIAKNIHEIKKDYYMALSGIKRVTEIGASEKNMYFYDILNILNEGMNNIILEKKIDVELKFEKGNDFLTSQHYYLISVFRNLLINALDAVKDNSENGYIEFTHEFYEGMDIFKIIDNGIGIVEEDLKYLFSPGFSTKIDYKTGDINRGLGLSITQDIVELKLKGTIKVYSELNKGTIFKIEIPREVLEVEK